MTTARRLHLRIERVVIDGAPEVRGERLVPAMVEELERCLADTRTPVEQAEELTVEVGRAPEAAGRAIARALYAELPAEVRDAG
jgi:hypothetical protein